MTNNISFLQIAGATPFSAFLGGGKRKKNQRKKTLKRKATKRKTIKRKKSIKRKFSATLRDANFWRNKGWEVRFCR